MSNNGLTRWVPWMILGTATLHVAVGLVLENSFGEMVGDGLLRPALRMETVFETTFNLARDAKTNDRGIPSHASRQSCQNQANRCYLDQGFAGLDLALVVLAHPAVLANPGESPLYDPSLRYDLETRDFSIAAYSLQIPSALVLAPLRERIAAVGSI